jgi:phytoene dehydrogenase-like protein
MTAAIEGQIERFAPGFRDRVLARASMHAAEMEAYNPNYVGGDINGGRMDLGQLFTRPVTRPSPYTTPDRRLFICSSSTPPGGGVHGMCGYFAAQALLKRG